jgi:HJR/Mrr/RecB family endonuclease
VSFAWLILGVLGVLGLLKAAASEMFQEEAKTRLEHLPTTVIRLAALGLPKEMRDDTAAEWQAELASVLRDTDGLPLTRLVRGVLYAVGMFRAAVLIRREMSEEETGVSSLLPAINCLNLDAHEFEHLLRALFEKTGLEGVPYASSVADGGIDLVMVSKAALEGQAFIQAKRYNPDRKVGIAAVAELAGSVSHGGFSKGIIVTTSSFTPAAHKEARRFGIELIDGEYLLWLLRKYLHREFTITKLPTIHWRRPRPDA